MIPGTPLAATRAGRDQRVEVKNMDRLILVVDDEIEFAETLSRYLRRFGYTCVTSASGRDALRLIDAASPHLVVTDLHMPGTDGLAVARRAREKSPPIPVILMTAYPTRETKAGATSLGGTSHLGKPFPNADLLRAVERAFA
jgi:CheY-like chemotaxis protein